MVPNSRLYQRSFPRRNNEQQRRRYPRAHEQDAGVSLGANSIDDPASRLQQQRSFGTRVITDHNFDASAPVDASSDSSSSVTASPPVNTTSAAISPAGDPY